MKIHWSRHSRHTHTHAEQQIEGKKNNNTKIEVIGLVFESNPKIENFHLRNQLLIVFGNEKTRQFAIDIYLVMNFLALHLE